MAEKTGGNNLLERRLIGIEEDCQADWRYHLRMAYAGGSTHRVMMGGGFGSACTNDVSYRIVDPEKELKHSNHVETPRGWARARLGNPSEASEQVEQVVRWAKQTFFYATVRAHVVRLRRTEFGLFV